MGKELKTGQLLKGKPHSITLDKLLAFEKVVWRRAPNTHSDPAVARERGMSRLIASGQSQLAFLHELMEETFDDGWVHGGSISVRWLRPVYEGDSVTAHARVTETTAQAQKLQVEMEVWCENQSGEKTSAGTAKACLP
jgi:acyl dehydratase